MVANNRLLAPLARRQPNSICDHQNSSWFREIFKIQYSYLLNDDEIKDFVEAQVPKNTKQKTK